MTAAILALVAMLALIVVEVPIAVAMALPGIAGPLHDPQELVVVEIDYPRACHSCNPRLAGH